MTREISKTLIIGLGGTGQSVIREVKKKMLSRYGEIPALVKFLSIDTDVVDYKRQTYDYYNVHGDFCSDITYNINIGEHLQLPRPPQNLVPTKASCKNLNLEALERVYDMMPCAGANGHRVMGRVHFLFSNGVMTRLESVITTLRSANLTANETLRGYHVTVGPNNSMPINVYIIASLAGGTGSSSFLDLPQMLRQCGLQYGNGLNNDKIFGVFYMPKFFEGMPHTDNKYINSYVALSELDYYLKKGIDDHITNTYYFNNGFTPFLYDTSLFSNVFLVDAMTDKGTSIDIETASSYVSSYLAASIAADANAITSSYVNANHKMHSSRGKSQMYSGIGYCEVRFDRKGLVRFLLNKQLDSLLREYGVSDMDYNKLVLDFINDHNLNEGTREEEYAEINQLTDRIYSLLDEDLLNIAMMPIPVDTNADEKAEVSKNDYVTNLTSKIESKIKNFEKTEQPQILKDFEAFLDTYKASPGFSTCFPLIANSLNSAFEAMRESMNNEILKHESTKDTIELSLRSIKRNIHDNNGIFQHRAQQEQINSYKRKVEKSGTDDESNATLARMLMQIERKKKAIDVYDDLIEILHKYYKEVREDNRTETTGNWTLIDNRFKKLIGILSSDCRHDRDRCREIDKEKLYLDSYFRSYFDSNRDDENINIVLDEFNQNQMFDEIKGILISDTEISQNTAEMLRNKLLGMIPEQNLVKQISDGRISIDEMFLKCFGDGSDITDWRDFNSHPQLRVFEQLKDLFCTLWSHEAVTEAGSLDPQTHYVIGVNNVNDYILSDQYRYAMNALNTSSMKAIALGDPDKIVFILLETAIPAWKLYSARVMKDSYVANHENVYAFTDKRLEDIDMLWPEEENEVADQAWAYGWLHGLIVYRNGRCQIKPTGRYMNDNDITPIQGYYDFFKIKIQKCADFAKCYKVFKSETGLVEDIYNQIKSIRTSDPSGEMDRIKEWINSGKYRSKEVRGKQEDSMSDAEIKILQKEPQFLELGFKEMNTTRRSIKLNDDLTVSINE